MKINKLKNSTKGEVLWEKAKKVIPGGNMLLSKRSEMYLPGKWPSYFSRSKGCKVWDLDGNEYIDTSVMSVGTNILGYANQEVDNAVKENISKGNMSTLNCPEEVYLAEKLIELHPWSDMVRFARSGGEANAIAIRIARASTGKEKIAICGYHGWHDWYLATNLKNNSELEEHLLPGLDPIGVPKSLSGTTIPFRYNEIEQLESIVQNNDLAAIKMEVQRSIAPQEGFLEKVRKICDEKKIVLIFDECTSGFRETYGGLHLKYKVNPDMAMFGKALGNGYAITSVIGKRDIMQSAQDTFISSTFWTERIGPTAALKTLEVMHREKSWEKISNIGGFVKKGWLKLAKENDIDINIGGLDSLANFVINHKFSNLYKTFITQEMLKRGYLASNSFYASVAHEDRYVSTYLENLSEIFATLGYLIKENRPPKLLNEVAHQSFKRLN